MKKLMTCGALLLSAVLALAALGGCANEKPEPKNTFVLPNGLVAPTLTPAPKAGEPTPTHEPETDVETEPEQTPAEETPAPEEAPAETPGTEEAPAETAPPDDSGN